VSSAVHTSGSIAALVGGTLVGPANLPVRGLAALGDAEADHLTFVVDLANANRWPGSRASTAATTAARAALSRISSVVSSAGASTRTVPVAEPTAPRRSNHAWRRKS